MPRRYTALAIVGYVWHLSELDSVGKGENKEVARVLKSFEYLEPETVGEAVDVLSKYGARAKILAGGLDLVDRMRRRNIVPECVVSIQRIPGLDYIKDDGKRGLRIGALTTLRSVELSPIVHQNYMLLWEAASQIASIQVKNMGTLVGNLCVATPASDVASALVALGAKLRIAGPTSERTTSIQDFYTGVNRTTLQAGEIVIEVLLPAIANGTGGAFIKLARTAADIAKVNVAVTITVADDTCKEVKIALGSVAPTVIRAVRAEEILRGQRLDTGIIAAAGETAAEEVRPITDIRSTAEFRKETTKVLVRRAMERAISRALERTGG